ncbi:hypothetical protein ISS08_01805 [Candidatus Pacearchaeota archaeon]|nr:hypothetical protein [Candidatus Pacearchaeota archaeon]
MNKKKVFNQIARDIKSVKIQGAKNVAKKALEAYYLIPTKSSKKKLLSLRPTEPFLQNVLNSTEKLSKKQILNHFEESQDKINKLVFKIIKNKDIIFTHCHSSTVVKALIYSKKKKKKFEVYNTETRPLFQGRKTSRELKRAGIKVTQFVDSAAMIALTHKQGTKKVKKVLIGADAIFKDRVINKVGSGMFSKIAYDNKIPVYVLADSWKYSSKNLKLEQRSFREVWKKVVLKIKIQNPAFEAVPRKYIKAIVSELGILKYFEFLKKK